MRLLDAGDPFLARPASPVTVHFDQAVQLAQMLQHELETKHPTGLALAAPQVGIDWRIFVTRTLIAINPVWLPTIKAKFQPVYESCLSLPDRVFTTHRWTDVLLVATDENQKRYTKPCSGLLAQVVQHECDHLDGRLLSATALEVNP